MTVGWLSPKILLPAQWREWEPGKLEAALAHERAHIRRADWAIRVIAGLDRCIFWFNPLAWWLERHLAMLAEQACDDAALLVTGAREAYAQTLLDMAAAVRAQRGRLNWDAMAMTKPSEVTERIERVLDEARRIPRGLARRQRAALLASATVAVYLTAALQPSPARGQQQAPAPVSVPVAAPGQFETVSDAEAARLEAAIAANPEDLASRAELVQYYTAKAMVQQRDAQIFWIVEHHPEFDQSKFPVLLVFSNPGPLQDIAGDERLGQLWQEQARAHANDPRVVMNAAQYLIPYYRVRQDLYAAERWEKRRRDSIRAGNGDWEVSTPWRSSTPRSAKDPTMIPGSQRTHGRNWIIPVTALWSGARDTLWTVPRRTAQIWFR